MKYKLSDVSIKPNSKRERQYCRKHNIELRRLANGITIAAIPFVAEDMAFAKIDWQFPVGAYLNPPGSVHFFEHFFNKKVMKAAVKNSIDVNAYTSQISVVEMAKGICNPDVDDFGIWEMLLPIRNALETPITKESEIESEKQVIADEIRRNKNDHERQTGMHFLEVMYAKDNPLVNSPIVTGEEKYLEKITFEVLESMVNKILIPDGLLISVYTEGKRESAKLLTEKIVKLFKAFPRNEAKSQKADIKLRDKINPDFKAGEVYVKDTGINNKRISFEFVWVFNIKFPDPARFAVRRIVPPLYANLHEYSRMAGWGYYTDVFVDRPSDNLLILTIRVDTNKIAEPEKFAQEKLWPAIKEHVVKKVDEKVIEEIYELEDKKQRAIPIRTVDRLDWMISGLSEDGKMIDADVVQKIHLQIKPKHMNRYIKDLLTIKPAVIITGDLS